MLSVCDIQRSDLIDYKLQCTQVKKNIVMNIRVLLWHALTRIICAIWSLVENLVVVMIMLRDPAE